MAHFKTPVSKVDGCDNKQQQKPKPLDQKQLFQKHVDVQNALHPKACNSKLYP